jgi:hypothetical protein
MRIQCRAYLCAFIGALSVFLSPLSQAADSWQSLTVPSTTTWSKSYSMNVVWPPLMSGKNGAKYRVKVNRNVADAKNNEGNINLNTSIVADMTAICDENHVASVEFDEVSVTPTIGNYKVDKREMVPAQKVLDKIAADVWMQRSLCDNFAQRLKEIPKPKISAAEEKRLKELPLRAAQAMECSGKPDIGAINEAIRQDVGLPGLKKGTTKFSKVFKFSQDIRPYGYRASAYAVAMELTGAKSGSMYRGTFISADPDDVIAVLKKKGMVVGEPTVNEKPGPSWVASQPDPVKRWAFTMSPGSLRPVELEVGGKVSGRVLVDETTKKGIVIIGCAYDLLGT